MHWARGPWVKLSCDHILINALHVALFKKIIKFVRSNRGKLGGNMWVNAEI